MIVVTRLNGTRFAVNPDLIERLHASPDTYLVMVDGTTYVVSESMDTVIELIARYRARVVAAARAFGTTEAPRLSVVPEPDPRHDRSIATSGPLGEPPAGPRGAPVQDLVPTVLHPTP
ncbi:hypothetical protein GCM10011512_29960 [Tersicoccus solisilvae]|uniref:Flagellar protein FlbD n=1 Tax=Tersicoccus solisilvae TaxID=1882339 RepID=A0ABQ1PQF7_9MICC|nr:flagellar FlbD family protein [Tersicoccus solisilvae]GGD01070.1 hypothetical protein GCM10011512_29960 [Tersicoccus solisilvae]